MVIEIPTPEKGYCPRCSAQQLFVPVWKKNGSDGTEHLAWKCTKCGYQVEYENVK